MISWFIAKPRVAKTIRTIEKMNKILYILYICKIAVHNFIVSFNLHTFKIEDLWRIWLVLPSWIVLFVWSCWLVYFGEFILDIEEFLRRFAVLFSPWCCYVFFLIDQWEFQGFLLLFFAWWETTFLVCLRFLFLVNGLETYMGFVSFMIVYLFGE